MVDFRAIASSFGLVRTGAARPVVMVRRGLVALAALTLAFSVVTSTSAQDHGTAAPSHGAPHGAAGGHDGAEETAPETFVVLDLFGEALEAGVIGIGVKIAELKPKVEHINMLYGNGPRHEAFTKVLGISTEVVLLGFLIETFGIGELFVSALSFSSGWAAQFAQSTAGIMISTKASLLAGEKVEEAAAEKYEHEIHAEASARRATHKHSHAVN